MRKVLVAALIVLSAPVARADPPPAPRTGTSFAVPLYGTVVHPYDAPDNPFAAGHRGVDVSAPLGTPVRAAAAGTVSFAGNVAGDLSVTIDHDPHLKTGYSFLGQVVARKGQHVERGDVIGLVGRGHPNSGLPPHVHLSARRDGTYFDPLALYTGSRVDDLLDLTG
jgi:murein DD-endopeptidase MepM/ murein hydrolase activator NlpD